MSICLKRTYPFETEAPVTEAPSKAIETHKYGSIYYHTVHKQTESRESPQDTCAARGAILGHCFYICHETRNNNNIERPYKSYASYESMVDFVNSVPCGPGSQSHHNFYEVWKPMNPGFLSFDVEWMVYDASKEESPSDKLRLIHRFILDIVGEVMKWTPAELDSIPLPAITTDSRETDNGFKESFHFYYKGLIVRNNHEVTLALYDLMSIRTMNDDRFKWETPKGEVKCVLDFSIASKNRCFRLAFSNKTKGGSSFLTPISSTFLNTSMATINRASICSPPWAELDSNSDPALNWRDVMILMSSTGFVPTDDVGELREITLDAINAVLIKEHVNVNTKHTARIDRHRRTLQMTGQMLLPDSGGSGTTGTSVPLIFNNNSNSFWGSPFTATASLRAQPAAPSSGVYAISSLVAAVLNKHDSSFNATVKNVSQSGCIELDSTSRACRYKSGDPLRPIDHKSNTIRFIAIVRYPVPIVWFHCWDVVCRETRIPAGKIQVPIADSVWFNAGYHALIVAYYASQRVTIGDINQLFQ